MVLCVAHRALALDVAIRQEHVFDRIVELLDRAAVNQFLGVELQVDVLAESAVLSRIGRVVIVERDMKAREVAGMFAMHALYELIWTNTFGLGAQHNRRAVGIVGADIVHFVPLHFLKPHPDVGLDIFDQVTEVNAAIGVGQGRGDKDLARHQGRAAKSPDSNSPSPG